MMANAEWRMFVEAVPWFVKPGQQVDVGASAPPGMGPNLPPSVATLFPPLAECLRRAATTPVSIDDVRYRLHTWQPKERASCGWLSPLPSPTGCPPVHEDHYRLLASFGGMVELSNPPDGTWLINQEAVLTASKAWQDASVVEAYSWAFQEAGVEIPIDAAQFYSIAREANGNTTFCNRQNGEVVLFAPDHAFEAIEPYPGCPEYTLYRFRDASTFREWVNMIAADWLLHLT